MDDFLTQRHHRYTTRPHEIAAIVGKVTRQPIASYEKRVRGYDNEVYIVTLGDDSRLVVRIRRHGELPIEDEVWAIEQAYQTGVPVPVVHLCESFPIDGTVRPVMVQGFVDGQSLTDLAPTLTADQLQSCVVQAAQVLSIIHRVRVEGWYKRRHGQWDFADYAAIATSNLADRRTESAAAFASGITPYAWDRLITTLDTLQRRLPSEEPVLLHGDFTPEHLLFDDSLHLCGVIDWGESQGGSPMVDLVSLLNADLPMPVNVEWLRAGYGAAPIWDHFEERRMVQAISYSIGSLNHHYQIGDLRSVHGYAEYLYQLVSKIDRLDI